MERRAGEIEGERIVVEIGGVEHHGGGDAFVDGRILRCGHGRGIDKRDRNRDCRRIAIGDPVIRLEGEAIGANVAGGRRIATGCSATR